MVLPLLGILAAAGGAAALGSRYVVPWIEEAARRKEMGIREGLLQNVDPSDPYATNRALMMGGLLDEEAWMREAGLGQRFDIENARLGDQFNREQGRLASEFDRGLEIDWTRLALEGGYTPNTGPLASDAFTLNPSVEVPDDVRKTIERTDSLLDTTDRFIADMQAYDETPYLTFPGTDTRRAKDAMRTGLERTAGELVMAEAYRRSGGNEPTGEIIEQTRREMGLPADFYDMDLGQLGKTLRNMERYRDDLIRSREGAVGRNDQRGVSEVDTGGTVSGDTLTTVAPAIGQQPDMQSRYSPPQGGSPSAAGEWSMPLGSGQPPMPADPGSWSLPPGAERRSSREGRGGSLLASESGGNWQASNSEGMLGRAQFSPARLDEARQALGIDFTAAEFRNSPRLQQAAERWHFNDIGQFIQQAGLDRQVGRRVKGVPITLKGLLFAAHLGGKHGMRRFIESGGKYDPADSNGTRLSDYLAMGARETYA